MKKFGALPAWILMLFFFFLPLAVLLPEAFSEKGAAFVRVFQNRLFLPAILNTLILGLLAGGISAIVGTIIAVDLAKQPENKRKILMTLLGLPLAFSGLVIAYGFILAFGRSGLVTQLLAKLGADPANVGSFIYSVAGLGVAYAYYLIPRVALVMYPVFVNLDKSPFTAARTLGASKARAFYDAVLPEILPSVISAGCLVSAIAMGTYGTALALSGSQLNILPLLLLSEINDVGSDFPAAAAMSIVLMGICVIVLSCGDIMTSKRDRGNSHG